MVRAWHVVLSLPSVVTQDVFLGNSVKQPLAPAGVNLGGWLCLEDWFFSGKNGYAVSTGDDDLTGQGACLPPMLTQLDEHWPSEGKLVKTLVDSVGEEKTAEIFMAHRRSYVASSDLVKMKEAGIQKIRVPITWAFFADALAPLNNASYGQHCPEHDAVIVPDPFYTKDAALVTVPRAWFKQFLRKVGSHGMQVLIDVHAFPGGSSQGTYNGIWPLDPKFWTDSSKISKKDMNKPMTEVGQMVVDALINWVEKLPAEEFRAVAGLTLMNEPAHLSAYQDWADEHQVLDWLAEAAGKFRTSTLPSKGVKMYMNVIGTAFEDFNAVVPQWWASTFTMTEQREWAVMDIHWYSAWSGEDASGRLTDGGAYHCDDPIEEIRPKLQTAISEFTDDFVKHFPGLRSCSEFSLGTYDQALGACTDSANQELFLNEQVTIMNKNGIEPFFWTWRMPYGSVFEPGWSLKHALGKENSHLEFACLQPKSVTSTEL